jgi:orotidine-5'-phosphate decarboxylase
MADATSEHVADRLLAAIEQRQAPVCIGLDPVVDRLPERLKPTGRSAATHVHAIIEFCSHVLSNVAMHVPCVKFQSACFERYRHYGVQAMYELIAEAHALGLQVILDAKRGDIGISAEHYAAAVFGDETTDPRMSADWVTVNGYLGPDSIKPFIRPDRGAFVLVRTSNPGGDVVQARQLMDGNTVAQRMARIAAKVGGKTVSERGFSSIGAVVGATKSDEAASLRKHMPQQMILVPGFGAQGGGVKDVLPCFRRDEQGRGVGAIVTASRSVIYAYEKNEDVSWQEAVTEAAKRFADSIGKATGWR